MSDITKQCTQRSLFASPLIPSKPRLRFVDGAGEGGAGGEGGSEGGSGGSGGEGGSGGGSGGDGGEKKFTPITSQEELDKVLGPRLARERSQFKDYDQLKADSEELQKLRDADKSDNQKAIDTAKEEGRAEIRNVLAQERVATALEKALAGRTPDVAALMTLDRSKFVKGDGADTDAITAWVAEHSTEAPAGGITPKDKGQGQRGEGAGGGTVQAGRDAYESRHGKK